MIIQHSLQHKIMVENTVDADGDLLIRTSGSGMHLTPAEQDQLIQHLIAVRGAGRVVEILKRPWNGIERRAS